MNIFLGGTMLIISFLAIAMLGHGVFKVDRDWSTGSTLVIVAEIMEETQLVENYDDLRHMRIQPLATLASVFDSTAMSYLNVWFTPVSVQSIRPHIPVPAKGDHVLAVILFRFDGVYIVSGDTCPFMPGQSSMVIVDGLHDPAVARTIQTLREQRQQTPTTRPATDE